MIYGNGMFATAFSDYFKNNPDICIFASGVSNSMCKDLAEFDREKKLLIKTVERNQGISSFVYFSTCSVEDPSIKNTPYVKHKLEMESIVLEHPGFLVFRLPQVVGFAGNPNTLINFLYQSIKDGTEFELWKHSNRNIIGIDDVLSIVSFYIKNVTIRQEIINIANPVNYSMIEIVTSMEKFLKKNGIYDVTEKGNSYSIDISEISPIIKETNVTFDKNYLPRIIKKYYSSV